MDAWLGRQTREHGDVDVTVFDEHQQAVFEHLRGWHIVADEDNFPRDTAVPPEFWDGRRLRLPAHLHCRPPGELDELLGWVTPPYAKSAGINLEVMFNERAGDAWRLNIDPHLALPTDECFRLLDGIPTVVPEVLMFFKATAYSGRPGYPRPHDEDDFNALLPVLSVDARRWLADSITLVRPGHPWLGRLRG